MGWCEASERGLGKWGLVERTRDGCGENGMDNLSRVYSCRDRPPHPCNSDQD